MESSGNLNFNHSRMFTGWLSENKCNIVVSCYRKHKLFCIGLQGSGDVSTYFIPALRPMGLAIDTENKVIHSSSRGSITTYAGLHDEIHDEWGYFDVTYYPQRVFLCGDNDVHDLRVGTDDEGNKKIYYVSAMFNCICTPSEKKSFEVHWVPPWIETTNGLPPSEDQCHLNGMALVDGKPRFITSSCISNYYQAWREHHGEGVVYDILNETIVAHGLWAPHSPNWYNGNLWIAEAGTGQFGYIDLEKRVFVPMKFIPGFIRGITFYNDYALVNTSMDRHDYAFKDLPLGHIIESQGGRPHAGIWIIDMKTMDIKHSFEFLDPKTELYDVICVPNTRRMRIEAPERVSNDFFDL